MDKTLLAESTLTGRLCYLHKDLIRIIPDKSVDRYKNLPTQAKIKLGGQHSYKQWLNMKFGPDILEEFGRSLTEKREYGDEGPITPEEAAGTLIPEKQRVIEEKPNMESNEESDTQPEEATPDANEPSQAPEQSAKTGKRVTFAEEPEIRRSKRSIKAPVKLDL